MRLVSALAGAVVLVGLSAAPAAAGDAGSERITSYQVELAVQRDGSMRVQETVAYDFGGNAKHGIERDIDTEQKYDGGHDRRFPVSGVTVSSATAPDQVQVTDSGGETSLRIGDPDRTITGQHTYRISYTVAAATTRYDDRDELYWNAVGPGWDVPVGPVTVRVSGAEVTRSACYAGTPGGTDPCDSAEGGAYGQGSLAPGEALTVVAAFPAGSVATAAPVLTDRLTPRRFLAGNLPLALPLGLLAAGVPLLLLVTGIRRKRAQEEPALAYRGQYQPQPPAGLRPMLANTLLSGSFASVDPVAVLLDLSARGFVSISPQGKRDWRLVALAAPDASVPPEGHEVFHATFAKGPDTTLSAAGRSVARARGRLRSIARAEVVSLGWFTKPPGDSRTGLAGLGVLMCFLAFPLTLGLGFLALAALVGVALFAGGVLMIVHAFTRPAPRTAQGEIARAQLMSFKDTLARIDPTGVPAERRERQLGGLLPYAVVLGLAPQLAGAFATAGVVAGGYAFSANPMWWSTFAGDATRVTSPSSSSSSSGGGFSGGSSGGGGGGGGGGSW